MRLVRRSVFSCGVFRQPFLHPGHEEIKAAVKELFFERNVWEGFGNKEV